MKVCVVGAGMAGLGAARTIAQAGHTPIIFEKSAAPGGRAATMKLGEYTFDHGATIVSPKGSTLEQVMLKELPEDGLTIVNKPIYMHAMGRITSVETESHATTRYCYQAGMVQLAELLANGLELRLGQEVTSLVQAGQQLEANGELFDAVVLTQPVPLAAPLLQSAHDYRQFPSVRYRQCLSVLLAFDKPLDKPFHAVLDPDQSEPLTWLSLESVKIPGGFRAPEGHTAMVAQMSARYSRYNFERPDEAVTSDALVDIARILGKDFQAPLVTYVHRWQHSHASNTTALEVVNRPGNKIVLAGDAFIGARLHLAYESGIKAAQSLALTK